MGRIWLGLRAPDGGAGLGYRLACTARRRGVSFAPAKETKTGQRGTGLSPLQTPLTLGCAGYECCFSAGAEKQIRTARRCAPKVACGGIFIARALEREGRTTSPLPSSKEGNYAAGEATLYSWLPPYAHGRQHLPSAELRQAGSGTGTPSPAAGEGRGRGQMCPQPLISTV